MFRKYGCWWDGEWCSLCGPILSYSCDEYSLPMLWEESPCVAQGDCGAVSHVLGKVDFWSVRVPCLVLLSPGTFSMIHTGGRLVSMARKVSISGCARGSSRALRFPAVEKGWHGTPAHMHVARRMVFQCVMLAMVSHTIVPCRCPWKLVV